MTADKRGANTCIRTGEGWQVVLIRMRLPTMRAICLCVCTRALDTGRYDVHMQRGRVEPEAASVETVETVETEATDLGFNSWNRQRPVTCECLKNVVCGCRNVRVTAANPSAYLSNLQPTTGRPSHHVHGRNATATGGGYKIAAVNRSLASHSAFLPFTSTFSVFHSSQ